MNDLKLNGQIEVILLDENGQVKHREVKDNTITQAALKYMLYLMMSNTGLNNVTRATHGTSMPASGAPAQFGLYVMSKEVDIRKDTFRPPYVDDNGIDINSDVTFYNLNGGTTEASNQMITVDGKCYFDKGSEIKFALEYIKNTYTGIVRSVVIGRAHNNKNLNYLLQMKDVDLPADWYTGTANYLMEHTVNGTVVYKTVDKTRQFSSNLKTKIFTSYGVEMIHNNITNHFGGLIMNDTIFKVVKASISGSVYNVTLQYVQDWKNVSVLKTINIPFDIKEGMTGNATVTPVLVARPGLNKLEIFVTTSIGDHDGIKGAHVQKAVVDIADMEEITHTISDMGITPYAISGCGTTVGQYYTGFFHEGKYFLPFYYIVNKDNGTMSNQTDNNFQEGVVLSSDFKTVHNMTCYRTATNQFFAFVEAEEVLQCFVNSTTNYYVMLSQVLSGTNLETPITKGANDILRVIYRYKLS